MYQPENAPRHAGKEQNKESRSLSSALPKATGQGYKNCDSEQVKVDVHPRTYKAMGPPARCM